MDRTVRRSMRLAKNNRRKRRNRSAAKRLQSPIERNRDRMSVGEVMGLSPAASSAVNLSEARAMDSARAAAANAGAGRSRRRRLHISYILGHTVLEDCPRAQCGPVH